MYLVGSHLREPVEEDCVTPDMCIPIFPNVDHPEGREPVRTLPVFPFDNCYLWSGISMRIRVCAREEGFDWEPTTLLRGEEYAKWGRYEREDMIRKLRAQRAREPQPAPSVATDSTIAAHPAGLPGDFNDSPHTEEGTASSTYADSIYTYAGSRVSTYGGRSVDTLTEIGLLPDLSENFELQPVFHLWGDLSANLKQEDIPSPASLLEECDAITQ